jgi:hypothetical protein
MRHLAHNLAASRASRSGLSEARVADRLMILTSYETYCELRLAGRSAAQTVRDVQQVARELVLAA